MPSRIRRAKPLRNDDVPVPGNIEPPCVRLPIHRSRHRNRPCRSCSRAGRTESVLFARFGRRRVDCNELKYRHLSRKRASEALRREGRVPRNRWFLMFGYIPCCSVDDRSSVSVGSFDGNQDSRIFHFSFLRTVVKAETFDAILSLPIAKFQL